MILNPFTTLNNTADNVTYYLSKPLYNKNYPYSKPFTFKVPNKSLCCILRVGDGATSPTSGNSSMADILKPLAYFYYDKSNFKWNVDAIPIGTGTYNIMEMTFVPSTGTFYARIFNNVSGVSWGVLAIVTNLSDKNLVPK